MNIGIQLIAMALVVEPLFKGINAYRKELCAYSHTGEYNLDDDKKTADFCEQRDPATGKYGLVKIIKYEAPCVPGSGRIFFKTLDDFGHEHEQSWRLTKWFENRENRRAVSKVQATAIKDAGNNWPAPPCLGIERVDLLADRIDRVDLLADRIDRLDALGQNQNLIMLRDLKQIFDMIVTSKNHTVKAQQHEDIELAINTKDLARSVDGLKTTIQHHRKAMLDCATIQHHREKKSK